MRGFFPRAAAFVMLAVPAFSLLDLPRANASVAIRVSLEQLIERASAIAVVTPVDRVAVWEDGDIVTYSRVRIDRVVSGRVGPTLWIRTRGGTVGRVAQLVEGEAAFSEDSPSLVFLRPHVDPMTQAPTDAMSVVERAQGQFPVRKDSHGRAYLTVAADLGAIVPPADSVIRDDRGVGGAGESLSGVPLEDATLAIAARLKARVR